MKIYHKEQETEEILQLISNEVENIYLSELAKVEFNSAIFKKVRTNEFKEVQAQELIAYFENDFPNFSWIAVDDAILALSARLIKKYGTKGLRTLDSIQLACAIYKRDEIHLFKTSDHILKAIFTIEGLTVC